MHDLQHFYYQIHELTISTPLPVSSLVLGYTSNGATPPSVGHIKEILRVIYDLTKEKMKAELKIAKRRYRGLAFIGLSADTWTSRVGQGFIGIEISLVFEDKCGKLSMLVMCLACRYMPGSHSAEHIANVIRKVLVEFELEVGDVVMFTSDSGGGIPAAAKVLGWKRKPCDMHTIDTATGWSVGMKGTGTGRAYGEGAEEAKALLIAAKAQANVFKNATQKKEALGEAGKELNEILDALAMFELAPHEQRANVRPKALEIPGITRMYS